MTKYRVGAIGCGRKGTSQARAFDLHPLATVVAAADPDPDNLALFCDRFGVPGYATYEELLANEEIDISAPVLPVSVNPDAVVASARAGVKAVFSEKPISASLEDADRMVDECRSRGIPFAGADMFRNFSQYWDALEMIKAGDIGEVHSINLYQATDQISGGGCQGLSLIRMFAFDADVDWVTGWVTGEAAEDSEEVRPVLDQWSDDDQGMGGHVRFANGIEVFIHSRSAAKKGIEVLGTGGVFFSDHRTFHLWKLDKGANSPGMQDLKEIEGAFPDSGLADERGYDKDGWTVMSTRTAETTQSVIDALEMGIEPRSNGDNLRKVLEIAIGLRESHRREFAPVKFPLQDRTLKLYPKKARYLNKKDVYGTEWYADQIGRAHRRER